MPLFSFYNLQAMNKGTHSTINYLANTLLRRRVPKWYEAFYDPATGGFFERLGHSFKPIYTGERRLLIQCRLLAMFSHACRQKEAGSFNPDLQRHFSHIVDHYYNAVTGGWYFSVDDKGEPLNATNDLYALSFVVFSFSHYFRASRDENAQMLARGTLDFIRSAFRMSGKPGYAEALGGNLEMLQRTRRQNPHMHLLEACLFAADTWDDPEYLRTANEMAGLFYEYFFDQESCFLGEYYADDLSRHMKHGHIAEPGHYFEWVWLLKKHAAALGEPGLHENACKSLLEFANRYGWDEDYGGIYDEFDAGGGILKTSKRLWPFTEAMKANALMLDSGVDKDFIKERISRMVGLFGAHYMDGRGFWIEWLELDLQPVTDYMPGSTLYHVYFGTMETREILNARGPGKSLYIGPAITIYSLRRKASQIMRRIRMKFQN